MRVVWGKIDSVLKEHSTATLHLISCSGNHKFTWGGGGGVLVFCPLLHAILVTTYHQIQIMSAPLEVVKGDIYREKGKLCETPEKINLNLFFLLFLEKRWRNLFKFFFLLFLEKRWRK